MFFIFILSCEDNDVTPTNDSKVKVAMRLLQTTTTTTTKAIVTQDPNNFKLFFSKILLLRTEDDEYPGVIFDVEEDVAMFNLISLSTTESEVYYDKLKPAYYGTYEYLQVVVGGVGQSIIESTNSYQFLQLYHELSNITGSFSTLPQNDFIPGDILIYEGDTYKWFEIDPTKTFNFCTTKTEVMPYSVDVTENSEIFTLKLTEAISVLGSKDLEILLELNINNVFEFNDLDGDDSFEPAGDDHDGTLNGVDFKLKLPIVTIKNIQMVEQTDS